MIKAKKFPYSLHSRRSQWVELLLFPMYFLHAMQIYDTVVCIFYSQNQLMLAKKRNKIYSLSEKWKIYVSCFIFPSFNSLHWFLPRTRILLNLDDCVRYDFSQKNLIHFFCLLQWEWFTHTRDYVALCLFMQIKLAGLGFWNRDWWLMAFNKSQGWRNYWNNQNLIY